LSAVTRRLLPLAAAGLVACAGVATAAIVTQHGAPGVPLVKGNQKITICHATSSDKNPYNQLSVDVDSIVKHGHGDHPNDIIPPFDYVDGSGHTQHYPGKNWDATGQAIWLNGCEMPQPTTSTTTTTPTTSTTTTTTPTTSTPTLFPVQPTVKCVDDNGGTFTAVFGYANPNTSAVTVPVGSGNSFAPAPSDRGQPTTFNPGTVESAVTVTGEAGSALVWSVTVGGVTSTASATASFTPSCSTGPTPGPTPITISVKCVDNAASTYDATFAYSTASASIVPVGPRNALTPPLTDPPSTFQAGGGEFTVSGIPNGTNLIWTLITDAPRKATATAAFETKCSSPPTPQPIDVSVTCITDHGGTFDATFGYVNPNGTPVDIPSGPGNYVLVAGAKGTGQPTTFQPGTVTQAFTISGPAGSDIKWTVASAGATSVATANEAYPTHCGTDPPDPPIAYRVGIFVNCVTNNGNMYSATFGYDSEDTETNTIAIGELNRFLPAPDDRGQPFSFEPGHHDDVFTVTDIPNGTGLSWSLTSDVTRYAKASANFETKCSDPTPDLVPIGLFVTCVTNHGTTYDAVFGYTNDNPAEQIVPLGLANTFVPAPGNRGQPTTFEPGTVRNAVTVKGIPKAQLLFWSVDLAGRRFAVASALIPEKCNQPPIPPDPPLPEPTPPPDPPTPRPPPPDPAPNESGLFATCVLRTGSTTTFDAVFGYANASQQAVIIPVGRSNLVAPKPIDRGQPSVFRPGIVLNAFTVENVPRTQDVTWAVTLPGGEVRTATASGRLERNCITAPAAPSADLVLTKTVADPTLTAGQRGTYRIHVLNRGPGIALQVRIVDDVDPRLELLSASTNRGSCTTSGQRVTCSIAALPPGAPVVVVVAVRARGSGTITNRAVATHSRPDPTPGNNVDSAVITVTGRTGGVLPAFTG
jgi:uncharacterized repeat protein (TIGR01451 family)